MLAKCSRLTILRSLEVFFLYTLNVCTKSNWTMKLDLRDENRDSKSKSKQCLGEKKGSEKQDLFCLDDLAFEGPRGRRAELFLIDRDLWEASLHLLNWLLNLKYKSFGEDTKFQKKKSGATCLWRNKGRWDPRRVDFEYFWWNRSRKRWKGLFLLYQDSIEWRKWEKLTWLDSGLEMAIDSGSTKWIWIYQ